MINGPASFSSNPPLEVGTAMRLLTLEAESTFSKKYLPIYSVEIFEIDRVFPGPPLTYRLRDLLGEKIYGTVYPQEIRQVVKPDLYSIEEILDSKLVNGEKYVLVKYLGYGPSFNQWIPNSFLTQIAKT